MTHTYNNGSDWRKWDLHIHSNASDGKMSPQEIIDKAIEKGISVIALTDHHTAKNIDIIKSLSKGKDIEVISGIEFRTEYGSKSVHIIGLFPDEFNGVKLDTKALTDFVLSPLGLSETAIIAKGREINASSTTDKAFEEGMHLLQVDFKTAAELIRKYGGIVSAHAGSKGNSFEIEMKHLGKSAKNVSELYESLGTLKDELLNKYIDICEINKANDSEKFYREKFGRASIIASDAHKLDDVGSKYVWIKADPTFEGLKQILCEPEERAKIQLNCPEEKKSYNIIEKIKFVDNSGQNRFPENEIGFNSGLNAIIGGKSSGKSLLLHMIASEMGNETDIKDYQNITNNISIEVYYKDDITKNVTADDARTIEFLPQLHIENLVQNKQYKNTTYRSFNEFIEELIKQNEKIKSIFENCERAKAEAVSNIESSITEWGELDSLLKIAKNDRVKLGDKKAIENEIERIKEKINELTKDAGWSMEEKARYDELISNNQKQELSIKTIEQSNNEYKRLYDYITSQVKGDINKVVNFSSSDNSINDVFISFRISLDASLSEISKATSILIQNNIDKNIKSIETIQKLIADNSDKLKPLMEKNAIQTEVSKLDQQRKDEEKLLNEIDEKDRQIQLIREKITNLRFIDNTKKISDSYYNLSQSLNEAIAQTWSVDKTKLDIQTKTVFNNVVFINSISDIINMKGYLSKKFGDDIFSCDNYEYIKEQHLERITKLIEFAIKEEDRFVNFKQGRTTKEFLHAILKDCFVIEYDIKKGLDSIHSMSEGKKGIVILQLYLSLSQSDCPILIDQPEDNLDNRTVYQDLNNYIKECKKRRQIIMVSHNANLVVNTDAENIIVANQTGENGSENRKYRFEYINGALENTFIKDVSDEKAILYRQGIREHVCEILEGGVDAFKNREKKYHIK